MQVRGVFEQLGLEPEHNIIQFSLILHKTPRLTMQSLCHTLKLSRFYTMVSETIIRNVATESWFDQARFIPPDAIFALTAQYIADQSPKKVNLGQGTYRDENGNPWVLPSVRNSRKLLSQELNHEYLPIAGLADFRKEAAKLALGPELFQKQQDKVLTTSYPSQH